MHTTQENVGGTDEAGGLHAVHSDEALDYSQEKLVAEGTAVAETVKTSAEKSDDGNIVLHLSLEMTTEERALLNTFVEIADRVASESANHIRKMPMVANEASDEMKNAIEEVVEDIEGYRSSVKQLCQDTLDGNMAVLGGFPAVRDTVIEYLIQLITYQSRTYFSVLKHDASLPQSRLRVEGTRIYLNGTLDCIDLLRKANMNDETLTGKEVCDALISALVDIMLTSGKLSDEDVNS